MNHNSIEINARYYLQPRPLFANPPESYDVIDRALEYNHRPAVVFSNGTEEECREWVERNCEEPQVHTPQPWQISRRTSYLGLETFLESRSDAVVINMPKPPFVLGHCGAIVLGDNFESNAALISTAPALLALLEQYHAAMPTKESGALIAEAKGWVIE